MIIGVPTEIKNHEYRVGLTPAGAKELVERGHRVLIQKGAGTGVGFSDQNYLDAGAQTAADSAEIFALAELIIKVKEPQKSERAMLREGQLLFTYLHLAADREQTEELLESGATCIAYETVQDSMGRLPLLAPMSEVAGRMSIQAGAMALERSHGGKGILLGGVPGTPPARITIIGGGVVGSNAAQMALGLRAQVTILDTRLETLRHLDREFGGRARLLHATADSMARELAASDLVVGAVLIPGAAAPKLVTRSHLKTMDPGSALVDVAIDQGGCFETSRPTTHADPTYIEEEMVHYCVSNIPGAVARTSSLALSAATLPYAIHLAQKGWKVAMEDDPHFAHGLNVHQGQLYCPSVGRSLNIPSREPRELLT